MPDIKDLVFADETPTSQEESWLGMLGRNLASGVEKVVETPFAISDIAKGVRNTAGLPAVERALSQQFPALSQSQLQNINPLEKVPSAEQFRRGAEKKLGVEEGYFDPRGLIETIGQEAISNAAGAGLTGAIKGAKSATQVAKSAIGSAALGNLAEEFADSVGLGDFAKSIFHTGGSLVGGALPVKGEISTAMNSDYKKAYKNLPAKAKATAPQAQPFVDNLLEKISESPLKELKDYEYIAKNFNNLIQGGQVDLKKALDYKIDLNKNWYKYPIEVRNRIVSPIVHTITEDIIKPYGKTNPKFVKPWLKAEQDFKALKNRFVGIDKISNTLRKMNVDPEKIGKYGSWALKGLGYLGIPGISYFVNNPLLGVAGAGATLTADQANKFIGLLQKSPRAKKLAHAFTKNLMVGHAQNATKLLSTLNKELEKVDTTSGREDLVFA